MEVLRATKAEAVLASDFLQVVELLSGERLIGL